MAQLLVRGLDSSVIEALKAEARHHHRSLEAQVRSILRSWVSMGDFRRYLEKAASRRGKLRTARSSAAIIRESRNAR